MLQNIKESKAFYIVLSVLIAVVLWLYVVNVENPDIEVTISNIPVTFTGQDILASENLMVVSGKDATVTLKLQGKRRTLYQLDRNNIQIAVDLSKLATTGLHQQAYSITFPTSITWGENIAVLQRSTDYIDVVLGRMVTKTVNVTGVFEGSVAEGYTAGEFEFSSKTVEISGEEQVIDDVQYAKVVVSGDDLTQTLSADMSYTLIGHDGKEITSADIQKNTQTIKVTLPIVTTKDVSLAVNLKEGGGARASNAKITISPSIVTLSGEKDVLGAMKSLSLGTIDLSTIINSGQITYMIPLPANVSNISGVSQATVHIAIVGLTTQTVNVTDFSAVNIPDGRKATMVTKNLQVMVRGPADTVALIQSSNLWAAADLSSIGQATGQYTVPAKVYLNGYSDAGIVGEYNVVVSLKK
ncbi:MAG: CdaR family protein [Oscillospiraceae bacterium]|nr:CdaR family protein [Oscillospiraceae bacterium]